MVRGCISLLLFTFVVAACAGQASQPAAPASPAAAQPRAAASPAAGAPTTAPAGEMRARTALAPPVHVTVGVVSSVSDSGIFLAQERGYFQQEGLDVELVPFDSATGMIALGANQLDVGAGSANAALYNALARNVDLKIVADKGSNAPGYGFVALIARTDLVESGQLRDYADLKGRPVAILSRASGAEAQLEKALAQANLTTADVNLTTMQLPDMATALTNKSIDVALSLEPLITAGVEQGLFVRWKGVDEFYPNDQTAVIVYSPEFGGKAEAARRWMLAYVRGLRDYNDAFGKGLNKDAVIAVINQYTTVKDPNIARKMVPAALNPDGWVNLDDLLYKQSAYIRYGAMREAADLPRAVDNQYVEYALQQLGPYR